MKSAFLLCFAFGVLILNSQADVLRSPTIGYIAIDSDADPGCRFEWVDIAQQENRLPFTGQFMECSVCTDTQIRFAFHGVEWPTICIWAHGLILQDNCGWPPSASCIPERELPNGFVAPCGQYQSVYPGLGEFVFAKVVGTEPNRNLVVEWHTGTGSPDYPLLVYQTILYEDTNEIKFQYLNVENVEYPYGIYAIVGLENEWGDGGLAYLCEGEPEERRLHDGLAILFTPVAGVFVSPQKQINNGFPGDQLVYLQHLKNLTGRETSFRFDLRGNEWLTSVVDAATSLPITSTGLIPANDSIHYYVVVEIPSEARIITSDITDVLVLDEQDEGTTNSARVETIVSVLSWQTMSPMPSYRSYLGSARVGDHIYAITGYDAETDMQTGRNEAYHPSTDGWGTRAEKPTPVFEPSVVALYEKIYCIGGYDYGQGYRRVEVYDTLRDSWSDAEELPTDHSLAGAVAAQDERLYYTGGSTYWPTNITDELWIYEEGIGWSAGVAMNQKRETHQEGVAAGHLYVTGGLKVSEYKSGYFLKSCERYDDELTTWTWEKDMHEFRANGVAQGFGKYLYVAGGGSALSYYPYKKETNTLERYGPLPGSDALWYYLPPFSEPGRDNAASAIGEVNGKYYLYVMGGENWYYGLVFSRMERFLIWDGNAREYGFEGVNEAWVAEGDEPTFAMPTTNVGSDALELCAMNNTNCFGYWVSPAGAFTLEDGYIYRARFLVSTDEIYKESIPQFRFRAGDSGFHFWAISTHQSAANAHTLPDTEGTTYTLFYAPTDAVLSAPMLCTFDLLNFDPLDAPNATLRLENVDIDFLPIEQTLNRAEKKDFTFDISTEGWQFSGTIPPFTAPVSSYQLSTIQLSTLNNTSTFGYWSIELPDIELKPYRLYLAEFTVSSDQSEARLVPTLRVRMSDNVFEQTSELLIESADDALLPTASEPRTYRLYFSPLQSVYPKEYWEELHGGTPPHLILSFDVLSFDPDCASTATLSLDSVSLFTIDLNNL